MNSSQDSEGSFREELDQIFDADGAEQRREVPTALISLADKVRHRSNNAERIEQARNKVESGQADQSNQYRHISFMSLNNSELSGCLCVCVESDLLIVRIKIEIQEVFLKDLKFAK